jgi:hypothetical protein
VQEQHHHLQAVLRSWLRWEHSQRTQQQMRVAQQRLDKVLETYTDITRYPRYGSAGQAGAPHNVARCAQNRQPSLVSSPSVVVRKTYAGAPYDDGKFHRTDSHVQSLAPEVAATSPK